MPHRADPQVDVTGSLTFAVDGPHGSATGRVRGQGRRVSVTTDDPAAALRAAAAPGPGRPALAGLAELLASSGLSVEVSGGRGTVAELGDGVDSRLGRVVAGSRRIRPGRLRAVAPLAVAQVRSALPSPTRRAGLLAALVLLLAVRRHARAHG